MPLHTQGEQFYMSFRGVTYVCCSGGDQRALYSEGERMLNRRRGEKKKAGERKEGDKCQRETESIVNIVVKKMLYTIL